MAVTATVTKRYNAFGGLIVVGKLAFSGNYATGGDTVSLAGLVPTSKLPAAVLVQGQGGGVFGWVDGTTLANAKVKVFVEQAVGTNSLLVEHTAVAYVAGITGDTVKFVAFFFGAGE